MPETLYRHANISASAVNAEARTCEVCFASETPVRRRDGFEILVCDDSAADLSRLRKGGAVLVEHEGDQIGVVESVRIDRDRKCRAVLRFSKGARADEVFQDVAEGIRRNVSVSFQVLRAEQGASISGMPSVRITRWLALEVSLVAVPADAECGVARSLSTSTKTTTNTMKENETITAERERIADIIKTRKIFEERENIDLSEEAEEAISRGLTTRQFEKSVSGLLRFRRKDEPVVIGSGPENRRDERQTRSIGALIVQNDGFADMQRGGGRKSRSFELPVTSLRALGSSDWGGGVDGPQDIVFANERLTVADLLAKGATGSPTVRYPREVSFTPAATTVAEGAAKPEQVFDIDPVDAGVKKIAAWCKMSDELLQDSPGAQSYINSRLGFAVEKEEDNQILNGDGTGSNMIGILQTAGLQTQAKGGDTVLDAIRKGIGKIDANTDFVASGIVIHPTDWQTIELLKDTTGRYIVGQVMTLNEFGRPIQAPALWGKPVAVSKSIAQGTALVGAFIIAAQLFRRLGTLIEMTNSNEDDFKKNLVLIRAELRAALAVYAPAAFCQVTGL